MITPLVRRISSSASRTVGFLASAVTTAWSIRKTGAPSSDTPRSLSPRAAARTAIGVAEGDGETIGDAPKLGDPDTMLSSGLLVTVGVALGDGDGVVVPLGL